MEVQLLAKYILVMKVKDIGALPLVEQLLVVVVVAAEVVAVEGVVVVAVVVIAVVVIAVVVMGDFSSFQVA